jgi:hypothetical protein
MMTMFGFSALANAAAAKHSDNARNRTITFFMTFSLYKKLIL